MTTDALRVEAIVAMAVIVAAVVLLVVLAGAGPVAVLVGIVERVFTTRAGILEAVLRTIPLTIMGLGIALAFRARAYNIGMDGQLLAGATLAVALAPLMPVNGAGTAMLLVAGLAGGFVWGGIAGVIKGRFGGNEVIATIMLNYVAIQIVSWLVRGPMQEEAGIIPRSDAIERALRLPILFDGTRIHAGLVIAVVAVIVLAVVLRRSRFGFKLAVVGANDHAAHYAGISPAWMAGLALALSGAFAGLAGAIEITGVYGRLQEGFAPGFGITAIAVALIARNNPWMVPFTAFGFALLWSGLGGLARNNVVPFPLINIIEGAVVLLFLAGTVAGGRGARRPAEEDGTDG